MARQGEPRERTITNVRAFWEREAADLGATPIATIRDLCFRIHELHTLLALIPRAHRLLDAGCGTGFGTAVLARRAQQTVGIDFSAGMVSWARKLHADPVYRERVASEFSPLWNLNGSSSDGVEFLQADVLDARLDSAPFDVITAQRLLINLPSRETQMRALGNLRLQATEDAVLILGETTEQGYGRTDAYRGLVGLPPLERHWHNCYLDEDGFVDWPEVGWRVEKVLTFDTYMLLSKVAYPAACGPKNCTFLSAANVAAMELACVFRSRRAVQEVGEETLFEQYVRRVKRYDPPLGDRLGRWLEEHAGALADWSGLGHQRLILSRAC